MKIERNISNMQKFVMLVLLSLVLMMQACGAKSKVDNAIEDLEETRDQIASGIEEGIVYITDSVNDAFNSFMVSIRKVELIRSSDSSRVVVFENSEGVTYDLTDLNGLLAKLPGASVPKGSYSGIVVTLADRVIALDIDGNQITPFIQSAANTVCGNGACSIDIPQVFDVQDQQKLVIDFDLQNSVYDSVSNTVSTSVYLDHDGSEHEGYHELMDYDDHDEDDSDSDHDESDEHHEAVGVIAGMHSGGFDMTVRMTEHFFPTDSVITVSVDSATVFGCDDESCGVSSLDDLAVGMTVEVEGQWTGSEFIAYEVEMEDSVNIVASSSCADLGRSLADYSGLAVQEELEGEHMSVDSGDNSVTLNGVTVLIANETVIELERNDLESFICASEIPSNIDEVEVEYYRALDSEGNAVMIAKEIEIQI